MATLSNKIKGCFYGGAIGDCMGGIFESRKDYNPALLNYPWQISDDTQLTLATIESILKESKAIPEKIAATYLTWFNQRKITSIGSSTLQALQGLQVGGHWALVGRQGEYAAGNGAAMRIAPLAFINADRQAIRDICRITHRNDEAYTGALAIVESIKATISGAWDGNNSLIAIITNKIPDTAVRDRLIELQNETADIGGVAEKYGNSGHVVNAVPLAIYAAQQIGHLGFENVLLEIIKVGGDTDTTCSLAGNLMGTLVGYSGLPVALLEKMRQVKEYGLIENSIAEFAKFVLKINA